MQSNSRKRISIFLMISLLVFSLTIPSFSIYILGIAFGLVVLVIEKKCLLRINSMVVCLILFSLTYFYFNGVIDYSFQHALIYGACIVFYYILGLNAHVSYDKNSSDMIVYRSLAVISYGISVYVIATTLYSIITGHFSDMAINKTYYIFWNGERGTATHISSLSVIPLAFSGYLFLISSGKRKLVNTVLFFGIIASNMIMSNRIVFLFAAILAVIALIIKNKDQEYKKSTKTILLCLTVFIVLFVLYAGDIFGFRDVVLRIPVFSRMNALKALNYSDPRIERQLYIIQHFFDHMTGGGYYTAIVGECHNVWLDIYDYSGLVPFLLFGVITIHAIRIILRSYKYVKLNSNFSLVIIVLIAMMMAFYEEPVMRSCEGFFILFFFILGLSAQYIKIYQTITRKGES